MFSLRLTPCDSIKSTHETLQEAIFTHRFYVLVAFAVAGLWTLKRWLSSSGAGPGTSGGTALTAATAGECQADRGTVAALSACMLYMRT